MPNGINQPLSHESSSTTNVDKHIEIGVEVNRLLEIEVQLNNLLDRISGNCLVDSDEAIHGGPPTLVESIPTLISVLNDTPLRLQEHRKTCLDKLLELEDKLFGNVR